ncbi:MAG TPA: hypothetical protein VMZ92_21585, partial [Planctomycetota bacterium]|nr:hypothetical protein [Planctomycetota bacterium]
ANTRIYLLRPGLTVTQTGVTITEVDMSISLTTLDTKITSILEDTATTLPAAIAGVSTTVLAGEIDANVVKISDDSTAADNAEKLFDGTGYDARTSKIWAVNVPPAEAP